jgi:hypothetical protein
LFISIIPEFLGESQMNVVRTGLDQHEIDRLD